MAVVDEHAKPDSSSMLFLQNWASIRKCRGHVNRYKWSFSVYRSRQEVSVRNLFHPVPCLRCHWGVSFSFAFMTSQALSVTVLPFAQGQQPESMFLKQTCVLTCFQHSGNYLLYKNISISSVNVLMVEI